MSPVRVIKTSFFGGGDRGTVFEDYSQSFDIGMFSKRASVVGNENGGSVVILEGGIGTDHEEIEVARFQLGDGDHVETHGHRFEGYSNSSWDAKFIPDYINKNDLSEIARFRPVTKREQEARFAEASQRSANIGFRR